MSTIPKLTDSILRNETKWPEIFGLTEDEILEIMEAVRQYELVQDSQAYQDWMKMYKGIHREATFEQACRSWFACVRWIKSKPQLATDGREQEKQAEWEFLTLIRANYQIHKNSGGEWKGYSAEAAVNETYEDWIEMISHLPMKRGESISQETIDKLNTDGREYKYFIEKVETQEWLSLANLQPFVHSSVYGTLSGGHDIWTNDPNMAMSFGNKKDADEHRDKYFNYPEYKVTEHEFVKTDGREELEKDIEISVFDALNNWRNENERETIPAKAFLEIAKNVAKQLLK